MKNDSGSRIEQWTSPAAAVGPTGNAVQAPRTSGMQDAQRVLDSLGFIILHRTEYTPWEIGEIIPCFMHSNGEVIPGPVVVTALATLEEFNGQRRLFGVVPWSDTRGQVFAKVAAE
jgi:hypothetical protein